MCPHSTKTTSQQKSKNTNNHGSSSNGAAATRGIGRGAGAPGSSISTIMAQKKISPALKSVIWDMYVGDHLREALCPLCGLARIYKSQNSGFEGAHTVARRWFKDTETAMTKYYGIPSCTSCNNNMGDQTAWDYLYCMQRLPQLRNLMRVVYRAFVAEHQLTAPCAERMLWNVLEHLYGKKRFPLGGSLVNTKPIYEIARNVQLELLMQDAAGLTAQLQTLVTEQRLVTEAQIKVMQFE